MGGGTFGEAVEWPITDITRHRDYVLPDLNHRGRIEAVRRRVEANNASEDPRYCLAVLPFCSLNEGTHNLMGLARLFEAYYRHPEDLKAFLSRMADAQEQSIRLLADCGCDGLMGYDDWGLQDRLMISPAMFEEFFLGHYSHLWSVAHGLGMDVWLHSCGKIIELLPTMAGAGLNVVQMDQQENNGLENLDAAVGGRLAFWCPVDIQQTMVHGSIDDIRDYVRRMIATVGSHDGGLISMAYSQPNAVGQTPERLMAMCAAFREYGVYDRR
jgi:uroporphyrinogen-III decarboxylase